MFSAGGETLTRSACECGGVEAGVRVVESFLKPSENLCGLLIRSTP